MNWWIPLTILSGYVAGVVHTWLVFRGRRRQVQRAGDGSDTDPGRAVGFMTTTHDYRRDCARWLWMNRSAERIAECVCGVRWQWEPSWSLFLLRFWRPVHPAHDGGAWHYHSRAALAAALAGEASDAH